MGKNPENEKSVLKHAWACYFAKFQQDNKLQDLLHFACMYIRGFQLDKIFQSGLNIVNLICQTVKITKYFIELPARKLLNLKLHK